MYFLISVDCGPPVAPQNGYLERFNDTTEGSEMFYSCDQGLVPEGRMRANCTRNGWSPNPADLDCTQTIPCRFKCFFVCLLGECNSLCGEMKKVCLLV